MCLMTIRAATRKPRFTTFREVVAHIQPLLSAGGMGVRVGLGSNDHSTASSLSCYPTVVQRRIFSLGALSLRTAVHLLVPLALGKFLHAPSCRGLAETSLSARVLFGVDEASTPTEAVARPTLHPVGVAFGIHWARGDRHVRELVPGGVLPAVAEHLHLPHDSGVLPVLQTASLVRCDVSNYCEASEGGDDISSVLSEGSVYPSNSAACAVIFVMGLLASARPGVRVRLVNRFSMFVAACAVRAAFLRECRADRQCRLRFTNNVGRVMQFEGSHWCGSAVDTRVSISSIPEYDSAERSFEEYFDAVLERIGSEQVGTSLVDVFQFRSSNDHCHLFLRDDPLVIGGNLGAGMRWCMGAFPAELASLLSPGQV